MIHDQGTFVKLFIGSADLRVWSTVNDNLGELSWICPPPPHLTFTIFSFMLERSKFNKDLKNVLCVFEIDFDSLSYAFFQNENNDSQLRLLRANDNRRISLKKNWRNCAVDAASSWFIGCDGVIKGISNKAFNIWQGKDRKYHLKVRKSSSYLTLY